MKSRPSPLDSLVHRPARLRIMAALTALPPEARLEFTTLGRLLKLTDGKLGRVEFRNHVEALRGVIENVEQPNGGAV